MLLLPGLLSPPAALAAAACESARRRPWFGFGFRVGWDGAVMLKGYWRAPSGAWID